eukprot:TRINITY_DN4923_c0_g1_i1.p1 TRINITY_DN4923_c0_g1~~TRINITY_DN4923_c0_g1_i1.p1  ORF type:complete len:495 (-),score=194.48 TRINITY_DN4923_c0_g1_i1:35-1519(-)
MLCFGIKLASIRSHSVQKFTSKFEKYSKFSSKRLDFEVISTVKAKTMTEKLEYQSSLDKFKDFKVEKRISVVNENDFVLLESEDFSKFVQLKKNSTFPFHKKPIKIDGIIGNPWNSMFSVTEGKLVRCGEANVITPFNNTNTKHEEQNVESTISSASGVQKLDQDGLEELKKKGSTGGDIIQALMENSTSFSDKTEFSKEKYIKKKKKKYLPSVRVIKPSSFNICKSYYVHKPEKISHIRSDALALLLNSANIQINSKVAIVETCVGLVLGAVAERLAENGKIVNIHVPPTPGLTALNYLNLPKATLDTIHHLPLDFVPECKSRMKLREDFLNNPKNYMEKLPSDRFQIEVSDYVNEKAASKAQKLEDTKQMLLDGVDSLIIATKHDPESLLFNLWSFLSPSSQFVVYSQFIQPLAEIYDKLMKRGMAVQLDLIEVWSRDYQVLPQRTHPTMKMTAASGYLLSGIKVIIPPKAEKEKEKEEGEESEAKKQKIEE